MNGSRNSLFAVYKKHSFKDRNPLGVEGWIKVAQSNGTEKQAGIASLISDKIEFKIKLIRRDEEG